MRPLIASLVALCVGCDCGTNTTMDAGSGGGRGGGTSAVGGGSGGGVAGGSGGGSAGGTAGGAAGGTAGGTAGGAAGGAAGGTAGGAAGGAGGGTPLPLCVPHDGGLVAALAGTQIETVFTGAPLVDPVGLTFGPDGKLYVGNSRTWRTQLNQVGEILRLESDGGFTPFCNDSRLWGPGWVAFGPSTDGGFPTAYMGIEDGDEGGGRLTDQLLIQDGTTVTAGPDVNEPGRLEYVSAGTFAAGIYLSARASPVASASPNPVRLLRWVPGTSSVDVVPITTGTGLIGAVQGFTFGHGGALGTDLYVATTADEPYTPDGGVGLYRVDGGLQASLLSSATTLIDVAASPGPASGWGDYVYGNGISADGGGIVVRVSLDGGVQDVARGLKSYGSVLFGPDGTLYFTDIAGHAIHRVKACTP